MIYHYGIFHNDISLDNVCIIFCSGSSIKITANTGPKDVYYQFECNFVAKG